MILKSIDHYLRKWEFLLLMVAGICVLAVMIIIILNVVIRNVFNSSLDGAIEIVGLLLVGIVVLGFSYVQGLKNNIIVELITVRLSDAYKSVLDMFGYLLGLIVVSIISRQAIHYFIASLINGETTMGVVEIPLWPAKLILTVGVTTLCIRLLLDVVSISAGLFHVKSRQ